MSATRLISSPIISYFIIKNYSIAALSLFCFSSVLDFFDGYVARKFHQEVLLFILKSNIGSILDPVADKTLSLCVILSQTYIHVMPVALTCIVIDIFYINI